MCIIEMKLPLCDSKATSLDLELIESIKLCLPARFPCSATSRGVCQPQKLSHVSVEEQGRFSDKQSYCTVCVFVPVIRSCHRATRRWSREL